jgi:hypothetical protein
MLGFCCWREFENHQHLPLGVSIKCGALPERETSLVAGSMLNFMPASLLDEEKDAQRKKTRASQ